MRAIAFVMLCLALAGPAAAQTNGLERLYVLDCGEAHVADQSRWSPGVNVGKPIDISDNCYLLHHKLGWMIWDTGVPDAIAAMKEPMAGPTPWPRAQDPSTPFTSFAASADAYRRASSTASSIATMNAGSA